jgi:hypothetical protein
LSRGHEEASKRFFLKKAAKTFFNLGLRRLHICVITGLGRVIHALLNITLR